MPDLPLGAVIAFDFEKWDVDEEIAIVHGAGVVRTQVYRNYVHGVTAQRIRQILDEANLVADSMHGYIELEMLGGPHFDLSAKAPKARRAALEIVRGEAEYAHVLGCRDIIVHPVGPGCTRDDAFRPDALAESAEHVARLGEEADVRFLLENMPPPMFGADAHLLRRIVDAVDSPHLGLAYDSGHANIAKDPVGIVRTMGPRLWGVHLHDNDGTDDGHFLPGMGTMPFVDVARALAEVGFAGTFMLEIYRDTWEVRQNLTAERAAFIDRLRRLASGLDD
ncbi:MAG TPA: sugar phosphate isomerase/epimerase family protein [Phycisphaerae bacterium]|nr:sugar phosphate isomerase/epimerase family protein [Phycisphaerae bacterium]